MAAADTGKDKDASTAAAAAASWQETKMALLDSLLTCRLCTKRLDDDTRMLPCQHSFCTSCLLAHLSASSHLSSRSSTFTCPTCSVQTPRPALNNVDEFSRDERLCSLRIFLSQSEVSNGDDPGSNNRVKRTRVKRQRNGKSRDMNRNRESEISHQSRDVHITKSFTNTNDGNNKEEHCTANNESVTAGTDGTKVVISRRPSLTDGGDNSRVVSRRGSLTNGTGTDSRVVSRRNSLTNGQDCFDFPNGFLQKDDDLNELANLLMGHKKGGFFDYSSQMPVCQNGCVLSPKHASIHAGGMLCGGCGSRLALPKAVDALQFELAARMAIRAHLRWRLAGYYNEEPTGVTFTSDGHVVVALHGDGVVCTYDGAGGRLRHIIDGVTPFAVATDVQRGLLLVGDRRESTIKTYDFTGKPVTHFEPDIFPWISGVAALPENRFVTDCVLKRQLFEVALIVLVLLVLGLNPLLNMTISLQQDKLDGNHEKLYKKISLGYFPN
jgi:hypothetical protein